MHPRKCLYSGKRQLHSRLLAIGLASLVLFQVNTASADDRTSLVNFESDGNRFNRIGSQRLETIESGDQFWLSGDFDGNGLDDLVQISKQNSRANVIVHASDGYRLDTYITQQLDAGFWMSQRWVVGDFNGDDLDDLALVYNHKGVATAWIYASTGSGFVKISTQRLNANFWNEQRWETGDFDRDGRDDLVLVYSYRGQATAWIYTSTDAGFSRTSTQRLNIPFRNSDRWKTGDFNGDGRDDLVRVNTSTGRTADAWILHSDGNRFNLRALVDTFANYWNEQRWEVGDVNADGMDDLILVYGHNPRGATAWIYTSTGTVLSEPAKQRLSFSFDNNQRWIVTDMDGDNYAGFALVFQNSF